MLTRGQKIIARFAFTMQVRIELRDMSRVKHQHQVMKENISVKIRKFISQVAAEHPTAEVRGVIRVAAT
jgi:hypothetical protein